MEYELGKVFLRHTKTGRIYQYERTLAKHKDVEAIVPNPVKKKGAPVLTAEQIQAAEMAKQAAEAEAAKQAAAAKNGQAKQPGSETK